jgi:hypothetical protein
MHRTPSWRSRTPMAWMVLESHNSYWPVDQAEMHRALVELEAAGVSAGNHSSAIP